MAANLAGADARPGSDSLWARPPTPRPPQAKARPPTPRHTAHSPSPQANSSQSCQSVPPSTTASATLPAPPRSSASPRAGSSQDTLKIIAGAFAETEEGGDTDKSAKHQAERQIQHEELPSSSGKRKVPNVKQSKERAAKRFKSPLAAPLGVKSPGVRIILSPKLPSPSTAAARSPSQKSPSLGVGSSSQNKKRKLRSKIWTEFKPIYAGQTLVHAECIHCHKLFKANRNFGTSGCKRHLKSCEGRGRLDDMISQMKVNSSQDDSLKDWKFDQEKSEQELVKLIVVHELPFSFVEYSKFRTFISSLNPWFKHISRVTIKKYCVSLYEESKAKLGYNIDRLKCRVSLSADLWTSNQNLGYLCVTCHLIDKSWVLHKRILKFTSVETPHDGIHLFDSMLRCIQEWNIEGKIFALTLDNASTNDSFVMSLKRNLVTKSLLLHKGKLVHYRCAAHVLNIIAQEGLKAMSGAVDNIRESVKYTRSSPSRKERFEKVIQRVGISCTHRPILDVPTRWNSTYEMLKTAASFERAFEGLAKEDPQYVHQPSNDEWKLAKKLCSMLKVFCEATKVLSGSEYPTVHLYFHQIWEVKKMLEKEESSPEVVVVSMVNEMKKKLKKYWDLSFLNICIPVILDPRFKLGFLEFRLRDGFGNMAMGATYLSKIKDTFSKLFDEYSCQSIDSVSRFEQEKDDSSINVDEDDPWADWGQIQNQQKKKRTSELDDYLNEETVPIGGSFDILEHWKVLSLKYPTLAQMARDILATPASTVASESAFSTGERVISDYRSRLTSDTVEALICLQDWIRSS